MKDSHVSRFSLRPITTRSYIAAWVALVVLSLLTLGLSFAPLGVLHVPVALLIAAIKAAFVIAIFMHMADQAGTNRVALVFWVLLLGILIALTAADVATRGGGPL